MSLSAKEQAVIHRLSDAAKAFAELPPVHPNDAYEFGAKIHECMNIVAMRSAVYSHPNLFPVPTGLNDAHAAAMAAVHEQSEKAQEAADPHTIIFTALDGSKHALRKDGKDQPDAMAHVEKTYGAKALEVEK